MVEMEGESNRPIVVREDWSYMLRDRQLSHREVALKERVAFERDRRLIRALPAETLLQGGPLLSQLGSAGQRARVRSGHAW